MKSIFLALVMFVIASVGAYSSVTPNGGAVPNPWRIGASAKVTWDTNSFNGMLRIRLWNADSGSYVTIANSVSSTSGEYNFTIPSVWPTGNRFRVRVEYQDSTYLYMMSKSFFAIFPPQSPMISSNSSGEAQVEPMIAAYPNPANSLLQLRWSASDAVGVEVVGVLGEEISRIDLAIGQQTCSVSTSQYPTGAYMVRLRLASGQVVQTRFLVAR